MIKMRSSRYVKSEINGGVARPVIKFSCYSWSESVWLGVQPYSLSPFYIRVCTNISECVQETTDKLWTSEYITKSSGIVKNTIH